MANDRASVTSGVTIVILHVTTGGTEKVIFGTSRGTVAQNLGGFASAGISIVLPIFSHGTCPSRHHRRIVD